LTTSLALPRTRQPAHAPVRCRRADVRRRHRPPSSWAFLALVDRALVWSADCVLAPQMVGKVTAALAATAALVAVATLLNSATTLQLAETITGASVLAPSILLSCTCCPCTTGSTCTHVVPRRRGAVGGPKRVVVTPAGRRRYLCILAAHLACQINEFDIWRVLVNTNVTEDLEWCRETAARYSWVELVELPGGVASVSSDKIDDFLPSAAAPNEVYVRLDDDVVWLEPGFLRTMFEYREAHPDPFLIYANIINNAIIAHIHHRNRRFAWVPAPGYACMDPVGWKDPFFAEALHEAFLPDAERGDVSSWKSSFSEWECSTFERVSVNAVAWFGTAMNESLPVRGGYGEEHYLSVLRPREIGAPNVIISGAVCVHFAFHPQRQHLDGTGLLTRYEALAGL
jgi:hypothetical protein